MIDNGTVELKDLAFDRKAWKLEKVMKLMETEDQREKER